ncbi:MAG: extracellular solute-binding protein [Acidimicrobiales bacterium]|nr:extracellular solute-binding protein [Acidimicrobiales bacterium]
MTKTEDSSLRRITATVLAIAIATSLTTACSSDKRELSEKAAAIVTGECQDERNQTVTIYSGRTEYLIRPIIEAFACETGIDVRVRWGNSTDLAILIGEEGTATEADVFLSRSPGPVGFLESRGLLGTIDDEVLSLVDSQNRASSGSWIGFSGRKRVLVRNLDLVSDSELPESVFDLTEDRYRGRVGLPATNGSFEDWFTVFRDTYGDEVATQWLRDMVANDAEYYPNNRAIVEAAGRGEIDMGLVNHYYNFQKVAANGDAQRSANHGFAAGDDGGLMIIATGTVMDSSKEKDTANRLLTHILSDAQQTYLTNKVYEYPLALGVMPADVLPPVPADRVGAVDIDDVAAEFTRTIEIIEASGILDQ